MLKISQQDNAEPDIDFAVDLGLNLDASQSLLNFCGCIIDLQKHTIQKGQNTVHLRCKLWELFIALATNPNHPLKREVLIQMIWAGNKYTGERALTHSVCHLRQQLKKLTVPLEIKTLPKKGYLLRQNR